MVGKFNSFTKSTTHFLGNIRKMLALARNADKRLFSAYFLVSGFAALLPIAGSYLYKLLVDSLIEHQQIAVTIPLVLVAILGSRYVLTFFQEFFFNSLRNTYLNILMRNKLQMELNYRFYKKLSTLDISHFEDSETQDLISKSRDAYPWRMPGFVERLSHLFSNIVEYLAAFILLVPFSWLIPIVITATGIPQFLVRARFGKLQWSMYNSGAPEVRKLWYFRWLLSDRTALAETKIFQSQKALLNKFRKIQEYLYKLNKKPLDNYIRIAPFPQLFEGLVIFAFALWKLPVVLDAGMSVGDFTFFISLLSRAAGGVGGMVMNLGLMYEHNLYVDHYFDVLKLPKLVKEADNPLIVPTTTYPPKIDFKNVSFTYPGSHESKKVLDNISFTIEPEENIAIVGPNGAGKTTIVKLLCRFYDVDSGEILINGVNLKDLDVNDWYKYLGTLFQNFVTYNFTVRENIMLGNTKVKDEKLMRLAAKRSGAEEFIEKFPKKYDQVLGRRFEKGKDLSHGQWQKLAIARAFYEAAPILVLDEPTSAIDAEAEYEIFKNLNKYYQDKTLFLISHRFSTVRNADKIIVLKSGKILEQGTHDQLLSSNQLYAKMFEKQALGYK